LHANPSLGASGFSYTAGFAPRPTLSFPAAVNTVFGTPLTCFTFFCSTGLSFHIDIEALGTFVGNANTFFTVPCLPWPTTFSSRILAFYFAANAKFGCFLGKAAAMNIAGFIWFTGFSTFGLRVLCKRKQKQRYH